MLMRDIISLGKATSHGLWLGP